MEAIAYFLKANLVFIALYGVYLLALRRETWFNARRAWLLLTPLASVLIPMLPRATGTGPVIHLELPTAIIGASSSAAASGSLAWLVQIHLAVSAVLLAWLVFRSLRAARAIRSAVGPAASFFQQVRVPATANGADRQAMLAHEQAHAAQWHTVDVIVYEAFAAWCWTNPVWRFAIRELRLVHEHAADAIAKHQHHHYQALLVAATMNTSPRTLLHTFSTSNLKQRIIMLQNTRPARLARRKLLLALPALVLAIGLASWRIAPASVKAPLTEARVFPGIDQQPEFPGGMEALMKHLSANIRYPEKAREENAEGTVYVVFTVKASGAVTDASIKRGVRADIDAEALRVVKALPDWKPAMSGGKAVDAQMTLPIAFRLAAEK